MAAGRHPWPGRSLFGSPARLLAQDKPAATASGTAQIRRKKAERTGDARGRIFSAALFALPSAEKTEIRISGDRRPGSQRPVQDSQPEDQLKVAARVHPERRAGHAGLSIWIWNPRKWTT